MDRRNCHFNSSATARSKFKRCRRQVDSRIPHGRGDVRGNTDKPARIVRSPGITFRIENRQHFNKMQ